jgi:hypothetical protein
MARGLFVANQDVAQFGGIHQGVVGRQDRTAWNAKYDLGLGLL